VLTDAEGTEVEDWEKGGSMTEEECAAATPETFATPEEKLAGCGYKATKAVYEITLRKLIPK